MCMFIFSDPTPAQKPVYFKPATKNQLNYLDFTEKGLITGIDMYKNQTEFWDNFIETEFNINVTKYF